MDKDYPNVFLPDRLWKLEIKPNADAYYIYRLLVSPLYKKRIQEMASGTSGSMYNIAQGDFTSIEINLPSLPEQQRIADFFTALDAQIENERALLEDLRQLKKGLLQQMFV